MAENVESVHEMMRDAEQAEEPGNMKQGAVVGNSNGVQMTATELQSAGWVFVYSTRTGDRSTVNRNMLEQQLRKKFEDGSYAFTTRKPEGIEPAKGKIKCLLHKDDPNRALYDTWGLAHCRKANIVASHDLRLHMEKRHRREWATIDGERQQLEKQEEKAKENQLAEAIRLLAESNTASNNRRTNNGEK
mgnify:FL=1